MTVTIPATVTNLQEAFRGCTNLTAVTLEHTHNALVDGTVTMTNAFYGCTNLATVYCHNAPAINETTWHAFRIKSNGDVNVFNGTRWNDSETPVSLSGEIEATKKTNLVSFGDFTDTQIADMMTNGKSFTSDDHALDPTAKNFVLWGADGTNFETNLPLGGGGSAGDGISISGGYISQTTDQLTFTGTRAQWEALTSAEKAKYGLVNITDDEESGQIYTTEQTVSYGSYTEGKFYAYKQGDIVWLTYYSNTNPHPVFTNMPKSTWNFIANLPVGFRPRRFIQISSVNSTDAPMIYINTNGEIASYCASGKTPPYEVAFNVSYFAS